MTRRQAKPAPVPDPPSQPAAASHLKSAWHARPRWFRLFVASSLLVGLLLAGWLIFGPSKRSIGEKDYPPPPFSESPFLNVLADTHFVGTQECAKCHRGKHQSFLLTAHSRALAELAPSLPGRGAGGESDVAAEPPDASFTHQLSGRTYRVYRQDGQLRHQEIVAGPDGSEFARVDLPVRFRVGSGDYARTYLVEVDGFLHESPITWYTAKKQWGMSPGYDKSDHSSFERPIKADCLVCHAGRVEAGETVHAPKLIEKVIGCESCHGPGSRHVALRESGETAPAEDRTIVHPGKLPRDRLEAICSACHLMGPARVYLRGRQPGDFRPAMPLEDYCTDYRLDAGSEEMTVVGHMEQLRRSKCYQKSSDMSCLNCHDPHAREAPKDRVEHYRNKCLTCHTVQPCKLDEKRRRDKDVKDDCAACHMPRGDTDIPHIAFTHHRIGIHQPAVAPEARRVPLLVPTGDVSHLPLIDQKRNLGLAYLQAARLAEFSPYKPIFADRARILLETVYDQGLRDADALGALADIYLPIDPERSQFFARQTLDVKGVSAEAKAGALVLLAACELKVQNAPEALGHLKELAPLRRNAEDWAMLGIAYRMRNEPKEARAALEHALSIRPDLAAVHAQLAEIHRKLGNDKLAKEHDAKAAALPKR